MLPHSSKPPIELDNQRQKQCSNQIAGQDVARLMVPLDDPSHANKGDEVDADDLKWQQPCPALRVCPLDEQRQIDKETKEHGDMFDMARGEAMRA